MSDYVRVAEVGEIADPGRQTFEVDEQLIVLFHVDGEFFCLDDVCTHDGGPLGDGVLEDLQIACPRHGAKFDIRDGAAKTMPATEATAAHRVKVENGEVWVRLSNAETEAEIAAAENAAAENTAAENTGQAAQSQSILGSAPASTTNALDASPAESSESGSEANAESPNSESANAGQTPAELSEAVVREELKKVIDPELFVNIVDLGLVYQIEIRPHEEVGQSDVYIEMTLTSPMCPAGPQLVANCKQVVGQLPGVADTELKLVMQPTWTPDCMTDDARDQLGIF